MIELNTKKNIKVSVPESLEEDDTPKFSINDDRIREYYIEHGYVVIKNLINYITCEEFKDIWDREVKTSKSFIYRQASAKPEKHVFNSNKWVMNPILNLQSLDPNKFKKLREKSLELFSDQKLCKIFKTLFKDKPKIVQSMYFEGNSETWEHQDTYYLDSNVLGTMAGAWIALERIHADAGRFFICPKSHNFENLHTKENNIVENHDRYIDEIIKLIKQKNIKVKAPFMDIGDVLFWNSKTIHGSLASQSKKYSRSSITCHAIAKSHQLIQYQKNIKKTNFSENENSIINFPKDLSLIKNKMIFNFEVNFPKISNLIKNNLIKKKLI